MRISNTIIILRNIHQEIKKGKGLQSCLHVKYFGSLAGSEFWETDNLPRDFVSFTKESELWETESRPRLDLAAFSLSTDRFPPDNGLDSESPFNLLALPIAYGSMRCQYTHQFEISI